MIYAKFRDIMFDFKKMWKTNCADLWLTLHDCVIVHILGSETSICLQHIHTFFVYIYMYSCVVHYICVWNLKLKTERCHNATLVVPGVSIGDLFNMKMSSYQYRKSPVEIRRSCDRFISTVGFSMLITWYLYVESTPRLLWWQPVVPSMLASCQLLICSGRPGPPCLGKCILLTAMTAWNGKAFRVTGPLWGESFTSHRWFPSQRPSNTALKFLWC